MPPQKNGDKSSKRAQPATKQVTPPVDIDSDVFDSTDDEIRGNAQQKKKQSVADDDDDVVIQDRTDDHREEETPEKTIPPELLTRLLHEFFAKDVTRVSRDANATVGKYFDVFVREAIARTAVEKQSGFLEVEDLEKVTPQLLLDL